MTTRISYPPSNILEFDVKIVNKRPTIYRDVSGVGGYISNKRCKLQPPIRQVD